jgi:hypothetical protein
VRLNVNKTTVLCEMKSKESKNSKPSKKANLLFQCDVENCSQSFKNEIMLLDHKSLDHKLLVHLRSCVPCVLKNDKKPLPTFVCVSGFRDHIVQCHSDGLFEIFFSSRS